MRSSSTVRAGDGGPPHGGRDRLVVLTVLVAVLVGAWLTTDDVVSAVNAVAALMAAVTALVAAVTALLGRRQ